MVAKVVGDFFVHGGISEQLILLNGIPFLDNEATLPDTPGKCLKHQNYPKFLLASAVRIDIDWQFVCV